MEEIKDKDFRKTPGGKTAFREAEQRYVRGDDVVAVFSANDADLHQGISAVVLEDWSKGVTITVTPEFDRPNSKTITDMKVTYTDPHDVLEPVKTLEEGQTLDDIVPPDFKAVMQSKIRSVWRADGGEIEGKVQKDMEQLVGKKGRFPDEIMMGIRGSNFKGVESQHEIAGGWLMHCDTRETQEERNQLEKPSWRERVGGGGKKQIEGNDIPQLSR